MNSKIKHYIVLLTLPLIVFAASTGQPESQELLMQKIADLQKEITQLKTQTIEQRKQIVQLKSELFSLKYGSEADGNEKSQFADELQNIQSQIRQLQKENKRLIRLCELSDIDPKADPNDIKSENNPILPEKRPRPRYITVGQLFPDLRFKALDGTRVDIDKLQGKVVLIDFWATWCGPCIKEMPNVISLYNKCHDKGFEIIGISLDTDAVDLRTYLNQNQIKWPQYYDGKGWDNMIASRFNVNGIPATVLIGRQGIVRHLNLRGDQLEEAVQNLCQKQ